MHVPSGASGGCCTAPGEATAFAKGMLVTTFCGIVYSTIRLGRDVERPLVKTMRDQREDDTAKIMS
ncbi:MAG TPA: hypothetical protein VEI57_04025 [Nitrospirota bacterium]|nr:hypothetical protein [Nitrospirota bacterium]